MRIKVDLLHWSLTPDVPVRDGDWFFVRHVAGRGALERGRVFELEQRGDAPLQVMLAGVSYVSDAHLRELVALFPDWTTVSTFTSIYLSLIFE